MRARPALPLLLILTACQSAPPLFDADAAARVLFETDRAFARLSDRTDPGTAFAAYMAPDGMMLPRSSEGAVEGYDAVMDVFGDGDPGYRLLWQPRMAEVAAAGDMGWTWGQYQVVVDGETVSTGKYVNVWKKQADGSWKVRVDMGNQHPGPGREE
jgi:ketosteroid isomerase-like protein